MSEWGWVVFGYTVTYGAMTVYTLLLVRRARSARRRLEELG